MRLEEQIRRHAGEYGGKFSSHLVLDEPDRPDIFNQQFSFYFLSTDRFTIWNAQIDTARWAFWVDVGNAAYDQTRSMLTMEEAIAESKFDFEPAEVSSSGKVLTYQLVKREPFCYAQFGGLTFDEQWEKLQSEIARNAPPPIHESFKLDHKYAVSIRSSHLPFRGCSADSPRFHRGGEAYVEIGKASALAEAGVGV